MVPTSDDELGDPGEQTGWNQPEVAHDEFIAAAYTVTFASPQDSAAPMDTGSVDVSKDDASGMGSEVYTTSNTWQQPQIIAAGNLVTGQDSPSAKPTAKVIHVSCCWNLCMTYNPTHALAYNQLPTGDQMKAET